MTWKYFVWEQFALPTACRNFATRGYLIFSLRKIEIYLFPGFEESSRNLCVEQLSKFSVQIWYLYAWISQDFRFDGIAEVQVHFHYFSCCFSFPSHELRWKTWNRFSKRKSSVLLGFIRDLQFYIERAFILWICKFKGRPFSVPFFSILFRFFIFYQIIGVSF